MWQKLKNQVFHPNCWSFNTWWTGRNSARLWCELILKLVFNLKILNFIKSRSNDVFNVSHPKRLVILTLLRVSLSHSRKHMSKHTFLDTLNPIPICSWIKALNHFLYFPRFTNERKNFLKGSSSTFLEKPTLVLNQYFFMAIKVFQLNLILTYSTDS